MLSFIGHVEVRSAWLICQRFGDCLMSPSPGGQLVFHGMLEILPAVDWPLIG